MPSKQTLFTETVMKINDIVGMGGCRGAVVLQVLDTLARLAMMQLNLCLVTEHG